MHASAKNMYMVELQNIKEFLEHEENRKTVLKGIHYLISGNTTRAVGQNANTPRWTVGFEL